MKYIFSCIVFLSFVIHAMEIPLAKDTKQDSLTLVIPNEGAQLSLALSQAHIFTYRIEVDSTTHQEKIVGFHHYRRDQVTVRKLIQGTVVEVNNNLWIYIPEETNIDTFHEGYPLYKGKSYPKKTFFPSLWERETVTQVIQAHVNKEPLTWMNNGQEKYIGHCLVDDDWALRLIINCYPYTTYVLASVYPVLRQKGQSKKQAILSSLEVEQLRSLEEKARLQKIKNPELIKAVQAQELEKINVMLKEGADANVRDQLGRTGLMLAAQSGCHDIMRDLIDYGALILEKEAYICDKQSVTILDYAIASGNEFAVLPLLKHTEPKENMFLNTHNKNGETPLIDAIKRLSPEIVHLLLAYGADSDFADKHGFTPLMHVARLTNLKEEQLKKAQYIVALLLNHGATIDAVNSTTQRTKGYTPLMYAAEGGNTQLANQLLKAGADYKLTNAQKQTATLIAHNKGKRETEQAILLYKGEKKAWKKEHNATNLMYWAYHNNLAQMKKALKPQEINYTGKGGESALSYAAEHENLAAVDFLLLNGADPRNKCYNTQSTLYAYIKNLAISQEVKDRIADSYEELTREKNNEVRAHELQKQRVIAQFVKEIELHEVSEKTAKELKKFGLVAIGDSSPLIYAIQKRHAQAVELLCRYKIPTDGRDPLACAYALKAMDLLEILIKNEAATPEAMQLLFDRAMQDSCFEILDIIKNIPHFWFVLLKQAVTQGKEKRIYEICKRNVFITNEQAALCLFESIKLGHLGCAKALLSYFPNSKNYQNQKGTAPLHYAAQTEQAEIFSFLCKSGADVTLQDNQGRTARDYIVAHKKSTRAMSDDFNLAMEQKKKEDDQVKNGQAYQQLDGTTGELERKKKALEDLLARTEIDLNAQDAKGYTALYYAVKANDQEMVRRIIERGGQIGVIDRQGKTIFDVPCVKNIKKVLKEKFIEQVDDASLTNTPQLAECIKKLHFDTTQKQKLAVRLCETSSVQLLGFLCNADEELQEIVQKYVESYYDALAADLLGDSLKYQNSKHLIEHVAPAPMLSIPFVQFLLKNRLVTEELILCMAITAGNKNTVNHIIQQSQKSSWLIADTMRAAVSSFFGTFGDVLKNMPCIYWACLLGRLEIIKTLLKKPHQDINFNDKWGIPLWAIVVNHFYYDPEVVESIETQKILFTASSNPLDNSQVTLLECLLEQRYFYAAKFLLQKKDFCMQVIKNMTEKTALSIRKALLAADDYGTPLIIELVKLGGGIINAKLLVKEEIAIKRNRLFEALLQSKEVVFSDQDKIELLIAACSHGNTQAASMILKDAAVDPNILYENETPLMAAVKWQKSLPLIELLLKNKNVNIHVKNNDEETAINFARSAQVLDLLKTLGKGTNEEFNANEISTLIKKGKEYTKQTQFKKALGAFNVAYFRCFPKNETDCEAAYWRAQAAYCLAELGSRVADNGNDLFLSHDIIVDYLNKAVWYLNLINDTDKSKHLKHCIECSLTEVYNLLGETALRVEDKNTALSYFLKAAAQTVEPPQVRRALDYIKKLKSVEDILTQGQIYFERYRDYTQAYASFEAAYQLASDQASQATALFYLATMEHNGLGRSQNVSKACELFQKVAQQNVNLWARAGAWVALGKIYDKGNDDAVKKAVVYFKLAAEQRINKDAYYFGCYMVGTKSLESKNYGQALTYLLRAVSSHLSTFKHAAQVQIGYIYAAKLGIQDLETAKYYWDQAAQQDSDADAKQLALQALKIFEIGNL